MSVRCYRVWTAEEEEALRNGVQKHGIGSWEIIRQDANYRHLLADRTGVQLKDKWRNLVKFKHVSRVEADVAASKSATINTRRASGGSDRRGRNASAEPLVEIERQRQENIARNKQALAALMSNVEQLQASTARRRRPAISNGDQWHEVQEQLLQAFDALAGAVGESVVAEAAALACSQIADSASAQDSERQDSRVAVRWQQECARKIQAAEADVREAEDACQAAAEAEAAAAAARQARRHRQTSPPRPQRASKRAAALERKRYADYEYDVDLEGDDGANSPTESSSPKRFRHTRFTTEDRRFGIYDERRYQASAVLQHGAKTSPRPRTSAGPSRAAATAKQGDGETGMVDCPCGVTFDDGQGMIECERCKVWAHLLCLQLQMSQHPRHFHYNFEHYMCDLCQHELRVQAAQVGSRSGRASPRSTAPAGHRKIPPACTRPEAFSGSLPLAQASLDSARMHRVVVPSSGGQPLASVSPFAKASNGPKSQRRNTHDGWGASAAHSRKVEGNSEDEKPAARSGGRGRSSTAKGGRSGRGRVSDPAEAQPQHPARLLDSEDARHYSGFLGNMSGSEELSMDVPDLLASLLELGGAVPNAAARGASPPPGGRAAKAAASNHWESSAEAAGPRRGRDRHHKQSGEHGVHPGRGGHQWDGGREQWETPTVHQHSSRRPSSDASLPLHEAWMQHEAEWANMHGLRHTVSQEGAKSGTLRWGERNLRTPRHPRSSRVLWPTCLEPLVSRPGQASGRATLAPPSLWEPSPIPKKPRKVNHHAQQASSSSQSPCSPGESSGQLHHMRGHLRDDHHHRHSPGEPQFTSRRLPHSRSHRDMNGRRHSSHGRGDSPTSRLPKSTPGRASSMDHRGGQLGHLNGPLAVSLPLGDMPMEALDAALAGLDGDPHHELALDQAAMDLHDNDEVQAGELEQVVSGASEGSGGQLARTSSHYMGPVASDSLAHTWMHHAWADAGHVLNRQSLPPKKAAAAAASAAAEAQAAADAAAAEAVGVAFGVEDMGGNLGVSELDSRPESPSPKDEGLGDLAAHLVAFHNMGASPSHDDPFASGTAKVSFDDGDGTQADDASAHSPVHAHSQRHNGAGLIEQDHPFDGSDRATPLGLGSTEEGEGEMFAEIDQMINVNQDAPLGLTGEGYSEATDEAQRPDMLEAA